MFLTVLLLSSINDPGVSACLNTIIAASTNPYRQIETIPLPDGYEKINEDSASFAKFPENMNLKENTTVYRFNGKTKPNQSEQYALQNISTGHNDLQQCADAVMSLRAESLYDNKYFDRIIFYDNDHMAYRFTVPFTRERFYKYLVRFFGMCGSASLSKQWKPIKRFSQIQPDDVMIRGGFPCHAVMVMDVAVNVLGKKIY